MHKTNVLSNLNLKIANKMAKLLATLLVILFAAMTFTVVKAYVLTGPLSVRSAVMGLFR